MPKRDPINETDEEARQLARRLLSEVRHGAIAVTDPESGAPHVTRVAVLGIDGAPHILISDLSTHTKALAADPPLVLPSAAAASPPARGTRKSGGKAAKRRDAGHAMDVRRRRTGRHRRSGR